MTKQPSLLALAAITAVLAGCATTPADETEARSTPVTSATASARATPSATPSATLSGEPTPEPAEAEPAPVEQPAEVPVVEAPTEPPTPEASTGAPFAIPPASPHTAQVLTPEPEWDAVRIVTVPGATFTVTGSGYEPGQRISIGFGVAQTDSFVFDDESAYADAAGNYAFPITLAADLPPNTYAVVTSTPDGKEPGPEVWDGRLWGTVEVIPR